MPKEVKKGDAKVSKRAAKRDDGDKKKKRSKKDPGAPKRGLSAYMFFSQEHRKQVQADNPEASFGSIGKILGEKWKNMSDKEKQVCFQLSVDTLLIQLCVALH